MSKLNVSRISIKRDELEDRASIEKIDRIIFWAFITALALIPILIGAKAKLFVSPLISGSGITSTGYQLDFFTYFKLILLLIISIATLVLLLYKIYFLNYKLKLNVLTFSLVAFIVALTLSVVFAEYKSIALWGMYNRHDGAITFISYIVLMIVALNITYPKNALNKLVYTLYPFIWINMFIAILNLYGINILQNSRIEKLFTLFLMDGITLSEGQF